LIHGSAKHTNRREKVVKRKRFDRPVRSRDEVRGRSPREQAAAEASVTSALGRETFAKISEVEGIRLSQEAKRAFAEFDAQGLSHEERRRAIIGRFKRAAE
jgi:hypothetical protein